MGDDEQVPAPEGEASAPQTVQRSVWNLSRDEQRALIITFAGGLASILVGACLLGLALATARSLHRTVDLVTAILAVIVYASVTRSLWVGWRRTRRPWVKVLCVLSMAVTSFFAALYLLALIGIAAGIH